ncbi:MAG: helix-turn-helix transcriptional regulator [Lachnospiraceae bacterium]
MVITLIDTIHFFMVISITTAIAVSAILFLGRNSKRSMAICVYFIIQLILEMIIRVSEVDTPITRWWNAHIISSVTFKGICYIVIIGSMLMAVLVLLNLPLKGRYLIAPAIIALYLLIMPSIQGKNMIFYCIYLIPCELFYLALGIFTLKKLKEIPDNRINRLMKVLAWMTVIFAVLIAAEDVGVAYSYGFYTEFQGFTVPSIGASYIKERSFTESFYVLTLAVVTILVCGKKIVEGLKMNISCSTEKNFSANAIPYEDMKKKRYSEFSEKYGLSEREQDLLPLLVMNRSIQEISEELYISVGTVKAHTHNIYQKTECANRAALGKCVEEYYKK